MPSLPPLLLLLSLPLSLSLQPPPRARDLFHEGVGYKCCRRRRNRLLLYPTHSRKIWRALFICCYALIGSFISPACYRCSPYSRLSLSLSTITLFLSALVLLSLLSFSLDYYSPLWAEPPLSLSLFSQLGTGDGTLLMILFILKMVLSAVSRLAVAFIATAEPERRLVAHSPPGSSP